MQFYERHHHHSGSGAENSLRKWRTTVGFGRLFWCVISSSSAGSSRKMPLKCALEWHHVWKREKKGRKSGKKLNEFKIITTTTIAANNQRSAPKLTQGREKSKVKKGREVTSERANILSCSCSLSLSLARSRARGWTQNSKSLRRQPSLWNSYIIYMDRGY